MVVLRATWLTKSRNSPKPSPTDHVCQWCLKRILSSFLLSNQNGQRKSRWVPRICQGLPRLTADNFRKHLTPGATNTQLVASPCAARWPGADVEINGRARRDSRGEREDRVIARATDTPAETVTPETAAMTGTTGTGCPRRGRASAGTTVPETAATAVTDGQ